MIRSLRLFVSGIFGHFWFWIPGVLLTSVDLYERFLRPVIPDLPQANLPPQAGPALLVLGVLGASFLTFHKLRQELITAQGQLDARSATEITRSGIGVVIASGNDLLRRMRTEINTASDKAAWLHTYDSWFEKAQEALKAQAATRHLLPGFQTPPRIWASDMLGKPGWASALIDTLTERIKQLDAIQRDL